MVNRVTIGAVPSSWAAQESQCQPATASDILCVHITHKGLSGPLLYDTLLAQPTYGRIREAPRILRGLDHRVNAERCDARLMRNTRLSNNVNGCWLLALNHIYFDLAPRSPPGSRIPTIQGTTLTGADLA